VSEGAAGDGAVAPFRLEPDGSLLARSGTIVSQNRENNGSSRFDSTRAGKVCWFSVYFGCMSLAKAGFPQPAPNRGETLHPTAVKRRASERWAKARPGTTHR
jgi:hypothetical protein